MGRIVIAVYRPFNGKEQDMLQLLREHVPVLKSQSLVTSRRPIVMRATDGAIIEIFEWVSAEAITKAHNNPVVQNLWERFAAVCEFEVPVKVKEFSSIFSEFEPIEVI